MRRTSDAETTNSPFSALLYRFRKDAELTQRELAARAGVALMTVSRLETGFTHAPRNGALGRLAKALELDKAKTNQLFDAARLDSPISLDDGAYTFEHGALWFNLPLAVFRRTYLLNQSSFPAPLVDDRGYVRWERSAWILRFGEPDARRLTPAIARAIATERDKQRRRRVDGRKK